MTAVVDAAPAQIYAALLDQGVYVGSIATMYRLLREHEQVRERRRQARHPARTHPELVADAPGQVYSWDITKLAGPVKGVYFDAYVMIDIYSRYIVGVRVHARESAPLAESMMREVFDAHGVPHVVHADRGTSMTSKSRPKTSNDNPYSESWFKTLKYAPVFPTRFASPADARAFLTDFVTWYNHAHRYSGIGLHAPADVYHGRHHQSAPAARTPSLQPVPRIRKDSAPADHRPGSSTCPTRSGSTGPTSKPRRNSKPLKACVDPVSQLKEECRAMLLVDAVRAGVTVTSVRTLAGVSDARQRSTTARPALHR